MMFCICAKVFLTVGQSIGTKMSLCESSLGVDKARRGTWEVETGAADEGTSKGYDDNICPLKVKIIFHMVTILLQVFIIRNKSWERFHTKQIPDSLIRFPVIKLQ